MTDSTALLRDNFLKSYLLVNRKNCLERLNRSKRICTPFRGDYVVLCIFRLALGSRARTYTRSVTSCGVSLPVVEDKNPPDVRRYYELNKKGEVAAAHTR